MTLKHKVQELEGSLSHQELADELRDYLDEKFPDDGWMVIVYSAVYGGHKHTFNGYTTTVHDIFSQDGHNIIVGHLPNRNSRTSPTYAVLKESFQTAFAPTLITCTTPWWGSRECHMDSEETNLNTWDNLKAQSEVNPLILLIASAYSGDGISLSRAISDGLIFDGFAVVGVSQSHYFSLIATA